MIAALAVCISVNFQILLPVVPVLVERGGPHGMAGAATAALFIGAVAGELSTPWLMSRQRSTRLLIAGQVLTAVPSLVYVIPHAAVSVMIAAASARGLGMGVSIVVSVALLSELTAPGRRGTSIGYFGLALGAPGIVVPTLGVVLLASGHVGVDALQDRRQFAGVRNISHHQLEALRERGMAGTQVVINDGFVTAALERLRGVTTDVSCSSDD